VAKGILSARNSQRDQSIPGDDGALVRQGDIVNTVGAFIGVALDR
jgi:hypothetical protein